MPTLGAKLDVALEGGTLSADLDVQAEGLAEIISVVTTLINNPPRDVTDLSRMVGNLPLPEFAAAGEFAVALRGIQAAVPTDLTGVTGGLTGQLSDLQTDVTADIVAVVEGALNAALALHRLTRVDLSCLASPGREPALPPPPPDPPARALGDPPPPAPTPPPEAAAAVARLNATLNALPSPVTVEHLLLLLQHKLSAFDRALLGEIRLPFLDELTGALDTLMTWRTGSGDDIAAHLEASLTALEARLRGALAFPLGDLVDEIDALVPELPLAQLDQISAGLIARLGALRAAVADGDPAATVPIVADLNALLNQYDGLQASIDVTARVRIERLRPRLRDLVLDLEEQIERTISLLLPDVSLGVFDGVSLDPAFEEAIDEFAQRIDQVVAWFQDLIAQIDLSALQAPLAQVAEGAREVVDGLEQGLMTLTVQVQNLFLQVEGLLDQIDMAAVMNDLLNALTAFKDGVIAQLTALFVPARAALQAAIDQISAAADGFDPAAVVSAFEDAIDAIASVFEDPQVQNAIANIKRTIEAVTDTLRGLSFAPVIDEVIDGIDTVRDGVQDALAGDVTPILREALAAALSVLPADIRPLTNPLIDELGSLIAAGPIPLLEQVKDQPAQLLDRVRAFDPGAVVGAALTEPFNQLIAQMEAFKPDALLNPVQAELDGLKNRLQRDADPGGLIAPLEPAYADLLAAFDALSPAAVTAPIDGAINDVVAGVLGALPLDTIFGPVDAVVHQARTILAYAQMVHETLEKTRDVLAALADAPAQIEAWLDAVLARLDEVADTQTIQLWLDEVTAAAEALTENAIRAAFDGAVDPLLADLAALNPQTRLAQVIQAHAVVSTGGLPNSPEKAAIDALLARMNPMQASFRASFQLIIDWRSALEAARAGLHEALAGWDARYHAPGSVLVTLRNLQATTQQLRAWVESIARPLFARPIGKLLALGAPLGRLAGALAEELAILIETLETQVGDLLLGPNSISAIRDSLQALIDRLQQFNLSFLQDNLNDLFAGVRSRLEAVNPAALRSALNAVFDDLLAALSLSLILPQPEINALNASYATVVAKIKALSPEALVTQAVTPVYQQRIVPLVESLDISEPLNALIERLEGLDDELRAELDRVNEAYQALIGSIKSSGISISVSISV